MAHSLFLFRKVIPGSFNEGEMIRDYVDKMSVPQPAPDPRFLDFLRREIPTLFRKGWDEGYRGKASRFLLPVSAVLEAGRRSGGGRKLNKRLPALRRVALGYEVISMNTTVGVSVVKEGSKARIVTKASADRAVFRPLHDTIYDHLSTKDWLLRGDAKDKSFADFTEVEGEQFVSGDYESATDNMSLVVYEEVLRTLSKTSTSIPDSVWGSAVDSSRSLFSVPGRPLSLQARGQLMGNYLSFPILCLVNYLTFRFSVRRPVPVRINGDDIVFRATPEETEKWFDEVGSSGLVLSKGKTLVDKQFFTLNSCLFRGTTRVRGVPFVRSKALFKLATSPGGIAGQYSSICPNFNGPARRFFQAFFLLRNRNGVLFSQRSLKRGLRMNVTDAVLKMSRLYKRERFYSRLATEEPLRSDVEEGFMTRPPEGFRSMNIFHLSRGKRKSARQLAASYHLALRLSAQCSPVLVNFKERVQLGTVKWCLFSRKVEKMYARLGIGSWGHWAITHRPLHEAVTLPVERDDGERRGVGWGIGQTVVWDS